MKTSPWIAGLLVCMASTTAMSKPTKTAPAPNTPTQITEREAWPCAEGKQLNISGHKEGASQLTLSWKGQRHTLQQQSSEAGAGRYTDSLSGLDLVVIPSKAMLFDRKSGQRLADHCRHSGVQQASTLPVNSTPLFATTTTVQ